MNENDKSAKSAMDEIDSQFGLSHYNMDGELISMYEWAKMFEKWKLADETTLPYGGE